MSLFCKRGKKKKKKKQGEEQGRERIDCACVYEPVHVCMAVCEEEVGGLGACDGVSAKNLQCSHAEHSYPPPAPPSLFTRRVSPAWHADSTAC